MSTSTMLTSNITPQELAVAGVVNLGSAIHGYGKGIRLANNGITIAHKGYYNIDVNASVVVTGATAITMQLYKDGIPIPGAIASATPSAAGGIVNLTIPYLIRKGCDCDYDVYTVHLDSPATVNSVVTRTERV